LNDPEHNNNKLKTGMDVFAKFICVFGFDLYVHVKSFDGWSTQQQVHRTYEL
jgi:hypothetical protein